MKLGEYEEKFHSRADECIVFDFLQLITHLLSNFHILHMVLHYVHGKNVIT
jgi:hypothetical protein